MRWPTERDRRDNETPDRGRVVFAHGLWLHATSLTFWVGMFEQNGYDCVNVSWPGESQSVARCRAQPHAMGGVGCGHVLTRIEATIRALDRTPVVIGHGVAGLLAISLLDRQLAAAAIAINPVRPRLLPRRASGGLPRLEPMLRPYRPALPPRDAFASRIANAVSAAEADQLYDRYVIPCASTSWTARSPWPRRSPAAASGALLLLSGGLDRVVAERDVNRILVQRRSSAPGAVTDYHVFPDRGHSMMVDGGWRDVAYFCLDWLTAQDL